MSVTPYDPQNWLVSATRSLGSYVESVIADEPWGADAKVEMSWPDTSSWTKTMPLEHILIHFEQDDQDHVPIGFGMPGVEVLNDTDDDGLADEYILQEAAQHLLNFDVGVWVSAEQGGATKRMEVKQALDNIFGVAGGKVALNEATGGLWVVSYSGGRNELDRINDVPVWRVLNCTLVLRVFSRHDHPAEQTVTEIDQGEDLTILIDDGTTVPI